MPKVVKTTDVPADPKRLYIYLYCDKLGCYKSTTKKKAAQSWLSLSESKRRRFLKTCRLKKDLNNTQRVLSTEPFLKQLYNSAVEDISKENDKGDEHDKLCLDGDNEVQNEPCLDDNEVQQNAPCLDINNGQQNETTLDDDNERQNNTCSENDNDDNQKQHLVAIVVNDNNNEKDQQRDIGKHVDINSICKEINGSDAESSSNSEDRKNQGTDEDEQDIDNNSKGFINSIKEPIPPTVKNQQELFEVINKDKNITFQDLNVSDKRTYQVLFTKIRKEYIEQYIQYLESLTDEQLYEHYLKEC